MSTKQQLRQHGMVYTDINGKRLSVMGPACGGGNHVSPSADSMYVVSFDGEQIKTCESSASAASVFDYKRDQLKDECDG